MDEYVKRQNEETKAKQQEAYKQVLTDNQASYDTAQAASSTAFGEIMRQMFDDNSRRKNETDAVLMTNKLNTGRGSQAALSQENTLRGNAYDLDIAQENARRDIDTSRQAMEDNAKAAVQQAIANADYNTANQLYTNFKTDRNTAQSQVNKLLSAGVMPDSDTITRSGYDLDYVKGLYQKAQQEAAAAAATKAAKITSAKQSAKEQASAAAKAIKSGFGKLTETAKKKNGNTATLVLNNMQNLKSAEERQIYILSALQNGMIDEQQSGKLLLLGTQTGAWSKPKITALELGAIDGDEPVDAASTQKLVRAMYGNAPVAMPQTVGEAKTLIANYILNTSFSANYDAYKTMRNEQLEYYAANGTPEEKTLAQLELGAITEDDLIARLVASQQYITDHKIINNGETSYTISRLFYNGYTEDEVTQYLATRSAEQTEADEQAYQEMLNTVDYEAFADTRAASMTYLETLFKRAGATLWNLGSGILDILSTPTASDPDAALSGYLEPIADELETKADRMYRSANIGLESIKDGKSDVEKFLIDASVVASDIAFDAMLNYLVPYGGLASMGIRSYEQGEIAARSMGLEDGAQQIYGLSTAAIEMLTEKMFSGLKIAYGSGFVQKAANKLTSRLTETSAGQFMSKLSSSAIGKLVTAGLGEGIEEIAADFGQAGVDYAFDLTGSYEINMEDVLYDGLLGCFIGLLGGGANIAVEKAATVSSIRDAIWEKQLNWLGNTQMNFQQSQEMDNWRHRRSEQNAKETAWQAVGQNDTAATANSNYTVAQTIIARSKQGAKAALTQALTELQNTGKVNTTEADVAAAVDAAISDDGSGASLAEAQAKVNAANDKLAELEDIRPILHPAVYQQEKERLTTEWQNAKTELQTAQNNQQQNIDNTVNNPYNESKNGGAVNDGNRMDSGMADGVPKRQWAGTEVPRFGELGRGNQELSRRNIISNLKAVLRQSGVVATELQNFDADSAAFSNALNAARTADAKNGWAVTPQPVEQLQGKQLYMDANGTIGFALTEDGDIEAVFKNGETNHTRHALDGVMPQAIALGGVKLDCYGERLAYLYENYGLVPVCRVVFNEEYANDGWDESKGKPYIYFLLHNGDSADTVAANIGKYNHMSLEDLENLPTFGKEEYDKAYAYRDGLLAQQQSNNGGDGLGAADAGFARQSPEIESWYADAEERGSDGFHSISDTQARLYTQQTGFAPNEVPKYDAYGQHLSRVASNALNSQVTPEAMHNSFLENARTGKFSYVEITDYEAKQAAEKQIKGGGWEESLTNFKSEVGKGKTGKVLVTKGLLLYNNAVTAGNYLEAIDILTYVQKAATSAAQTVQAMKILQQLSPDCQLYAAVKGIDSVLSYTKQKYRMTQEIEIDENSLKNYYKALESGDEAAIYEAWDVVAKEIAKQLPSSWRDKLDAIRYLFMLGNPRTHIRNIVGNLGFVPVWAFSDIIATGGEAIMSLATHGKFKRTKAFLNAANPNDRALLAVSWKDYLAAQDKIMSTGKYVDPRIGDIDKHRKNFKDLDVFGKTIQNPIETLGRANTNALEFEDRAFAQPAYAVALAGYLKANGISANEYVENYDKDERMAAAQTYAIEEARKKTYRDDNVISRGLAKLRIKPPDVDATITEKAANTAAYMLLEGELPYKKTPANLLVRATEYSPLGLLGAIAGTYQVRKGEISGAELMSRLSAGLTGTGLVYLGLVLAREMVLVGGNDDDEKSKLDREQAYSINFGDSNITLDWLAPEALPVFVGVEIYNSFFKDADDASFWAFGESLLNLAEPITEMSMLSGINSMLDTISTADNKLSAFAIQAATSYITQFLPTLGGQIERVGEDARQSTFIDRDSDVPTEIQYALGKAFNKLPFAEYRQIDYYDAWGRPQETGSIFERIANNFINPAYVNDVLVEDVEAELERLDALGESGMYPKKPSQSEQINGEYLTAEQYEKLTQKAGQLKLETISAVTSNKEYSGLKDADKAEIIRDAYSYATAIAKNEVNSDYEVPSWVEKAEEYGDVSTYIIARQGISNLSDRKKDTVCEYIDSLNISAAQKSRLYELMYPNYKNDYRWR